MKLTAAQFLFKLAKCEACFAVTLPSTPVRITVAEAAIWLHDALEDSTYKPTVRFMKSRTGNRCLIGMPMGHGTEVVP